MKYNAPDYNRMFKAIAILEKLPINDSLNPVLWSLDRLRWICDNEEFLEKIASLSEKRMFVQRNLAERISRNY